MFKHLHPYKPFVPEGATKLIMGTIPPPRFSTGELYAEDVNFCYGSKNGLLWPIMDRIFNLNLKYLNTEEAVVQRKNFLEKNKIGIYDIVESCMREKINASDQEMKNIKLRDVFSIFRKNPSVKTILFTGGNSKNGPEYLFRKYIKPYGVKMELISEMIPKIYQFEFNNRNYKTISLISPSNAANRSIGANPVYKKIKKINPDYTTFRYRLDQYSVFFMD
ncbi:MAG: uracil-DNA glycosylase family protein [Flavobacteriia bacterium]|nr:MAG: uracil-DNA glycosylase family protein [Flavobacteriia bacterium]